MVLGRGTDQRHAADVDVLDDFVIGHIRFGDGRFKGIQVDGRQVDVIPPQVEQLPVIGLCRPGQQSAVDGRVQSLDPSAQDFR